MTKYYKEVDKRSKKEMVEFLSGHFKYDTMNSWNRIQSYANNVKIYNLGLPEVIENKLYQIVCDNVIFEEYELLLQDMQNQFLNDWGYYPDFNGRSNGYVVLYQTGFDNNGERVIYPGREFVSQLDLFEEYQEIDALREEVRLVQAFDKWCDDLRDRIVDLVSDIRIVEEEYTNTYTVLVAQPA